MKKIVSILAVIVMVVSLVSLAFAGHAMMKGTVKGVDAKAGTMTFCPEGGKDEALKADKAVDLGKVKTGDKVEVMVENGVVKSVKEIAAPAKKAPMGC